MRQALWNVPSGVDTDGACRARGDTGSRGASRTRIEAERVAGRIDLYVDQQRGAKSDPRSVNRMDRDAENTGSGDARDFTELDKVERATAVHEWVHDCESS